MKAEAHCWAVIGPRENPFSAREIAGDKTSPRVSFPLSLTKSSHKAAAPGTVTHKPLLQSRGLNPRLCAPIPREFNNSNDIPAGAEPFPM